MAVIKFCGASVTSFNSRLGWGNNQSSIDINLVEDVIRGGDFFNPPALGQPCYFTFGPSFKFWGLLQNWNKQSSTSGLNLYTVSVKDPRDLLESTQLITGAYNGSTLGIPNILNCYGYWENTLGFGGANVNEGGMLWSNILSAVQTMTNTVGGTLMGGPLRYMGINYAVDLSRLPIPPSFYRLPGGPTISLLNAIQQICDDGGAEFFVELDPGTVMPIIRVYTVSRYNQPPFGTIAQITNQNWGGTVVRNSNGLVLRNDVTTHFLIGGQEQSIYETNEIAPFWGLDIDNQPIVNIITYVPGLGYCNSAYINVTEISDVFNTPTQYYFLTEFEMRFAAESGAGSDWEAYVTYENRVLRNNKARIIGPLGLTSMIGSSVASRAIDVVADVMNTVTAVGDAGTSQVVAQNKLRDFIKRIANNWYGKKFWVSLPFVQAYQDPETLVVRYSHDISDGGWLPEGQSLFDLQLNNILKFTQQDGRYTGVAVYEARNGDYRSVDERVSALQVANNSFYSRINIDRTITIWPQTGIPAALVTVLTPPLFQMASISGDNALLDVVIGRQNGQRVLQNIRAFGAVSILATAPYKMPVMMGIPLKSNVTTYGPWYLAGSPGKTLVEVASNLTPWEYGGTNLMQLAGMARVTAAATFMTAAEQGSIELVGMPLTGLGRALIAGGPETTNIEVRMGGGGQGLTTSYRFETFTQTHLNRFIANTQERIKRMGATQNEIRTTALGLLDREQAIGQTLAESAATALRRFPTWQLAWATPHPVIISSAVQGSGNTGVRVSAAATDPQEGWGGIGPTIGDDNLYTNSALTSLSAIVRPFANNPNSPSTLLPKIMVAPTGLNALSVANLNPYSSGNNDFEYLSSGDSAASGLFLTKQGIDWNSIRGIGFATPVIAVGWGYRIDGVFIPPNPSTGYKAGVIDLLYDHNRGCWTSHDLMFGYISEALPGFGGSGVMTICDGRSLFNKQQVVYNFYGSPVAASSYISAGYFPYSNKWQVISADCASGVAPS